MNPRKIDLSVVLVGLGALVLLVSLALEWYKPELSGLESFEVVDLLIAGLAVGAVASVLHPLGDPRAIVVFGIALPVIVISQLIEPPPILQEADLGTGAWAGLAGSVLVFAGMVLDRTNINVTFDIRDKGPRPAAAPAPAADRVRVPAVDRREEEPAPPPAPRSSSLLDDDDDRTQPFRVRDAEDGP